MWLRLSLCGEQIKTLAFQDRSPEPVPPVPYTGPTSGSPRCQAQDIELGHMTAWPCHINAIQKVVLLPSDLEGQGVG